MCAARRVLGGAPGRHPPREHGPGDTAPGMRRRGCGAGDAALRTRHCGRGIAGGTAAGALRYSSTNLACTPYCSLMVLKSSAGSSSAAPSALSNEAFERMTIELL